MDIKDVLELSDNKQYVITGKTLYNGDEYLYIVEVSERNNIKFCKIVKDGDLVNLVVVKDKNLIKELIPLMAESLTEFTNK